MQASGRSLLVCASEACLGLWAAYCVSLRSYTLQQPISAGPGASSPYKSCSLTQLRIAPR